jgi:Zn-dependent protease with chaperone function
MGSMSVWHWLIMMTMLVVVPVIWIVPVWRILSRTGHSGAWAILGFVPILNIILLWVFAFSKWPVDRNREANFVS